MSINERAREPAGGLHPTVDRHLAVGAFVCHALDQSERSEFLAHLDHCRPCRAEVRSFNEMLAEVGRLDVEPPPLARSDVLASIRLIRQVSPYVPRRC